VTFRVSWRSLVPVLVALAALLAASLSFGGNGAYGVFFVAVIVLLSFLSTAAGTASLRVYERLSERHPERGNAVTWQATLASDYAPVTGLSVRFSAQPSPEFPAAVLPRRDCVIASSIIIPHRGVYRIGMESLHLVSVCGFFRSELSYSPPDIYARVKRHVPLPPGLDMLFTMAFDGVAGGGEEDRSTVSAVRPYRDGDDPRRFLWKRFSVDGTLLSREYDRSGVAGIAVYPDFTPVDDPAPALLEDVILETALAIADYCAAAEMPVIIHGPERPLFAGGADSLDAFHADTTFIPFSDSAGPLALFLQDRAAGRAATRSLVITASPALADAAAAIASPPVIAFVHRPETAHPRHPNCIPVAAT
jgi:uncharacterized protein (DUF58 family)